MKTPFKVVIGILAVIAATIVAGCNAGGALGATADEFFAAVKQRDLDAAHTMLSQEFKASTPPAALQELLIREELRDPKEASWSKQSIENERGVLAGEMLTSSGAVVAVQLSFVKQNDSWKIDAIGKPAARP